MRRCTSRRTSSSSSQTGTCRAGPARSMRRPSHRVAQRAGRPAAGTSAGRRSPGARAPAPRAAARAGGGSSRPREARALQTKRYGPGSAVGLPAGAASPATLAPTSASGPSWRRPPWPGKTASSGACSRVWSVCGASGSTPWSAVSTSRSPVRAASSSQPATAASISCSARVEALDVLAVAVDLVGLDEVGEDQPGVELASSACVAASACAFVAPGCAVVDADAGEEVAHLADGVDGDAGVVQLVEVGARRRRRRRSPCAPRCARTRRAAPANGRAMTRPTACSPVMTSRAAAQRRTSSRLGEDVVVGGDLQHRVGRRVEDQLAGAQVMLGPELLDDLGAAGGLVAAEAQARGLLDGGDDLGREAVGVGRQRRRRHHAHELPVAGGRVLAGAERMQAPVDDGRLGGRHAARSR